MDGTEKKTLGTYRIPEENLGALLLKLDKLGRRSVKLGMPAIAYSHGAAFDVPFFRSTPYDGPIEIKATENCTAAERIDTAKRLGKLFYRRFVQLELTGETPRLAGYEFVATLQHLTDDTGAGINMLRSVPTFKESLPVEYRTASPENCDHCHKKIKTRKETFIVRHESGKWMQVGRSCTQDFLGGLDPHAVAAQLELFLTAFAICSNEESGFGGGGEMRIAIENMLSVTAAVVRVDGWTSRGRARNDESLSATADSVLTIFGPPPRDPQARAAWEKFCKERKPTAEDTETSEKALTYAREVLGARNDLGDYEFNLYVATTQASVGPKLIGITASLIAYYLKEMERLVVAESRRVATAGSVHFGTVKKREVFTVTCSKLFTKEGKFGTTFIHSLVTKEGNVATWFASSNPEMKIGHAYRVKATVKSHGEFRGTKQTVLTRVEVIGPAEEEPAPAAPVVVQVSDELAARRRAIALKAVATRRANLAAKAL